jgi:hypothetical protein
MKTNHEREERLREIAERMCECMDECSCGGGSNYSEDENLVTMNQGQEENERDFMQRNQEAESGEFVDGKVVKPKSKRRKVKSKME